MIEQLPNRIYPKGARAGISEIHAAFEKDRKIFSRQTYEILDTVETGNRIALEVLWAGTLSAGAEMRCHSAMFLEFRDSQIVAQRNYDCFDPW